MAGGFPASTWPEDAFFSSTCTQARQYALTHATPASFCFAAFSLAPKTSFKSSADSPFAACFQSAHNPKQRGKGRLGLQQPGTLPQRILLLLLRLLHGFLSSHQLVLEILELVAQQLLAKQLRTKAMLRTKRLPNGLHTSEKPTPLFRPENHFRTGFPQGGLQSCK